VSSVNERWSRNVRFAREIGHEAETAQRPLRAKSSLEQTQQTVRLFDNLVGERQEIVRQADARGFGNLQIDHERVMGWFLKG
jgi:hypothetical protein